MALHETIIGQSSRNSPTRGNKGVNSGAHLSWDPAANSAIIYLRKGVAAETEVADGGVIVERDRKGATLNLEILCVRQGLKPGAIETVGQHCHAAADALSELAQHLPDALVQIPLV